jgi:prevent-host-death family protein
MIVSVRESKARLSELLTKARQGEDVVITVRGKPSARIVAMDSRDEKPDMKVWARQIESRLNRQNVSDGASEIVATLREERG